MSMKFKRLLPIPKDIRAEMPLSAEMAERKAGFDAAVSAILRGEDERLLRGLPVYRHAAFAGNFPRNAALYLLYSARRHGGRRMAVRAG